MHDERKTGKSTDDSAKFGSGTGAERDIFNLTTMPSIRVDVPLLCQFESASQVADELIAKRTVIKERFELKELLGYGGMGSVYKARDLRKVEAHDPRPWVALKLLNEDFKGHPGSLKSLQREARKAQDLAHPNIVQVFDFDRDGEVVFMTMELLKGEDLSQTIHRNPQGLSVEETLRITREMIAALQHAHDHNIIHADFTPRNIFLTDAGITKVLDFGIARAVAVAGSATSGFQHSTHGSVTLGGITPGYAGIERLQGMQAVPSDDVFALGCVIYHLLCGSHPYKGRPATEALENNIRPERISALSGTQWRALLKAIALSRADRYLGVEDFAADFVPQPRPAAQAITVASVIGVFSLALLTYQSIANYSDERRRSAEIDAQRKELSAQQLRMEERSILEAQKSAAELARLSTGYVALFETLLEERRYDEAFVFLGKLRAIAPQYVGLPQLESRLAQSRHIQERQVLAEATLQRRVTQLMLDAEQYIMTGDLVRPASGNAFTKYMEIVSLDPENLQARLLSQRLVQLHLEGVDLALHSGNLEEAGGWLNDLVEIAPDNQNVHRLRADLENANALQRKRKEDSALLLAQASDQAGRLSMLERRELYLGVLQLDPANSAAAMGLEQVDSEIARVESVRRAKREEEAEALLQHAQELLDQIPSTLDNFSLAQKYIEESLRKSANYEPAIAMFDELPQMYMEATRKRMAEHDYSEAQKFLQAAIILAPRSERLIQLQIRLNSLEAEVPVVVPVSF